MTGFQVLGFSWVGVGTDDYQRTRSFFCYVLGLEVESEDGSQVLLNAGPGQQLEIFGCDGRGKRLNTPPTVAFEVDNFDAALAELRRVGVEIVDGPGEWNGHRWFYFRSPNGHLFEIKTSPSPA